MLHVLIYNTECPDKLRFLNSDLLLPPIPFYHSFLFSSFYFPLLFLHLCHLRYYPPTPPPCLSAAATAPHPIVATPGRPPLPKSKRSEVDTHTHLHLLRSTAAPAPLYTSPFFSCYFSFSICRRPASHGGRRAGEVAAAVAMAATAAATTSTFPNLLLTTWLCPTS